MAAHFQELDCVLVTTLFLFQIFRRVQNNFTQDVLLITKDM